MPFHEYLEQATGKNIDMRPTAEILRELDELERKIKEGGNHGDI